MKRIILLFIKEIKRYFDSPVAYITIIVFLIISGWIFSSTIFLINKITISNFIANVPLLLVFLAPAVTMQLIAGEFQSGTIEILGSLPIRDAEIIAGKFLAAFALLSSAIVLTLIYPVSISFFGDVDWGQVAGAYIGMILIGGTFLAAGLFASSISSNQVVAFIAGFTISFILFIAGKFTEILPSYIRPVIDYIGIDSHWENLSRGVISFRDIIYFFSLWVFFFYGALVSFSKRVRAGLYRAFSITLLFGILVILNILTETIVLRLDLTENNIYSLSKASKKVISNLEDPLLIRAYFSKNLPGHYQTGRKYLNALLHEYSAYSNSKIKFKFYDPVRDESVAREAMASGIPALKFTEAGKGKFEIKQGYMGVAIIYRNKKEVIPVIGDVGGLEYDLTTRIKKITAEGGRKVIGYIGSLHIPDELKRNIETRYEFIEIKSTGSFREENISSAIVDTAEKFSEKKLDIIRAVAGEKIPMGIFADRYEINMDNFFAKETDIKINEFLREYGLTIGKGLVLDRQNQRIAITTQRGFFTMQNIVNYPYFPFVTDLDEDNPVVRDLKSLSFPFLSPIVMAEEKIENFEIKILARTSNNSWLDENPSYIPAMRDYFPPDNAVNGPFPVVAVIKEKDTPFRMVLISNTRFVKKEFMPSPSNKNFFLNVIDWLTEDYDLISIRSKGVSDRPMKNVSSVKKTIFKYMNIFMIPVIVLCAGVYRWKSRNLRSLKKKQYLLNS